ncbi:MAG: hypothetical protein H6Q07_2228 [Acidobacteria bacterium]|jgi:hypothetical protein|nr:hypothetical protein [Acidobacteriota bacterium]
MLKRMTWLFVAAAIIWAAMAISEEKKGVTADRHKERGLKCEACHKDPAPTQAATGDACLPCHKSLEAVAERMKDYQMNPHKNHITDSSDVACTDCHQGHKPDTLLCGQCHTGMVFEKMKPEEK